MAFTLSWENLRDHKSTDGTFFCFSSFFLLLHFGLSLQTLTNQTWKYYIKKIYISSFSLEHSRLRAFPGKSLSWFRRGFAQISHFVIKLFSFSFGRELCSCCLSGFCMN